MDRLLHLKVSEVLCWICFSTIWHEQSFISSLSKQVLQTRAGTKNLGTEEWFQLQPDFCNLCRRIDNSFTFFFTPNKQSVKVRENREVLEFWNWSRALWREDLSQCQDGVRN